MRHLLEHLPHVEPPDPARESDDPGVPRERLDDDLVRPVAEEDLTRSAARGRRSPLARHILHVVGPFDGALPLPVQARLFVEGIRVTDAHLDVGFLHQGLERRAVGLGVDDVELWRLVGRADPAPVVQLGLTLALERLAGVTAPERARVLRDVVVDLVAVREALWVLGTPALRATRLARGTHVLRHEVDALLQGLVEGDTLAAVGGLRRDLHHDERSALLRLLSHVQRGVEGLDLTVLDAFAGVGVLPRVVARTAGVDGPIGRALGLPDDTVCDHAFRGHTLESEAASGCTRARLRLRWLDARAALVRVEQALREWPDGAVRAGQVIVPDGVAHSVVRGPSGSWSVLAVVRQGRLTRLRLRPPEIAAIAVLPRALFGVALDDVAAVIASFGVRVTALDR
jgi:Ni,Fe-hydrogenase III large subunit